MTFDPSTDELLQRNRDYADGFSEGAAKVPRRGLAVVACMDSRIDTLAILGLANGEAHVIRNAGGVVTDDVIRSLCLSQRSLETREIILVHHTDCGLKALDENAFRTELEEELGVKPSWSLEAFADPYDDVRQSIRRLQLTPFIQHKEFIRGFVYEVTSGLLKEVDGPNDDG